MGKTLKTEVGCSEKVVMTPISELHAPDCHPFFVQDNDEMTLLVESVKQSGVREPGLARPNPDGGYELLCGNRRKRACEIAGISEMPIIVRELTNDEAVITMVDSNLQHREHILPSERAWAYRIKLEALNHSGVKSGELSCNIIAEQAGESKTQVYRFVRLTELIDVLLDKVDVKQLSLTPAVELSYLSYEEQRIVAEATLFLR
jgi:ParB family chromosome partitioning protein